MALCTICGERVVGTRDDDDACCPWCESLNMAGAELRSPVNPPPQGRRLAQATWLRVLLASEQGRSD